MLRWRPVLVHRKCADTRAECIPLHGSQRDALAGAQCLTIGRAPSVTPWVAVLRCPPVLVRTRAECLGSQNGSQSARIVALCHVGLWRIDETAETQTDVWCVCSFEELHERGKANPKASKGSSIFHRPLSSSSPQPTHEEEMRSFHDEPHSPTPPTAEMAAAVPPVALFDTVGVEVPPTTGEAGEP